MLLGMIATMDEEARSEDILSIETLSRLMSVLTTSHPGAETSIPQWGLVGLALDVLLNLLHDVSSDFLEEASDCIVDADIHTALVSLLEYDSNILGQRK